MVRELERSEIRKVWIDEHEIMHCNYLNKINITLKTAKDEIEIISKFTGNRKLPMMINISNVQSITKEAREFYSGEESAKVFSAVGIIVQSPVHEVIGNFFLGINRPSFPVKLFKSEEKAIEWLKGMK
jgi:hypothetical protein